MVHLTHSSLPATSPSYKTPSHLLYIPQFNFYHAVYHSHTHVGHQRNLAVKTYRVANNKIAGVEGLKLVFADGGRSDELRGFEGHVLIQ
jgi:hypothetical protein